MIREVRILFTFVGGSGHFLPAVPVARVLLGRGHQVAFSCQEGMLAAVRAEGFDALDSGGRTLPDPTMRSPLLPLDRGAEERVIRDAFAGTIARERARRLIEVATRWQPDVIVRDEVDFGAAIAAERLGIPHAAFIVLLAGGLIRPELVGETLDALRREHGLPADPQLAMLHPLLALFPAPAMYRSPADPLPPTTRYLRPAVLDEPLTSRSTQQMAGVDRWLDLRPGRPVVYFTLGTVFHQESGDLFSRVIAGLCTLDAAIVVTVGHEFDPAEVGAWPGNVHVARFIPQALMLPRCELVVSHGGSGSVIGALAFGVPLLILPMGADQPLNGDRCQALGVASVLDPVTADSEDIHLAAADMLRKPGFKIAAETIREQAVHLETAESAAGWIQDLGSTGA